MTLIGLLAAMTIPSGEARMMASPNANTRNVGTAVSGCRGVQTAVLRLPLLGGIRSHAAVQGGGVSGLHFRSQHG